MLINACLYRFWYHRLAFSGQIFLCYENDVEEVESDDLSWFTRVIFYKQQDIVRNLTTFTLLFPGWLDHKAIPFHHFVRYNRSPISPRPGTMYPFSSISSSTAPTRKSVPSVQVLATCSNPTLLARMERNVMCSTPHDLPSCQFPSALQR